MTNEIKIHILHTGLVKVDKALPFHGKFRNPLAFTGMFRSEVNQTTLPVSSYLIEHPKGLLLIDTSWNSTIRDSNFKELGFQVQINTGYLPSGWAVDEQMEKLGYQTSDIDLVLMSHLHCDHASGLPLVKDAKKILVSDVEWSVANRLPFVYLPHEWKGVNVETYHFEKKGKGPFNQYYDVFGDGSVLQIFVPGHSSGMAATLIKGSDGRYIVLAADTGYSHISWEQMLTPGICISRKKAITSLGWMREISMDSNCIAVFANHDSEVSEQTICLPYK
ncbi:N-acyl homoserine lactonase family protein [Fructobacillus sp. M158]|uniref:N-acyl homoserine lactonase family protein n=1 Tax=Fructobacillus parabroussonetiae TaxID=2713174 RepID=UPI00200AD0B1|nr:N-acyl homoserine lactonase family protein [Fructobacillus parabroussonetiae]MCK8617062.1 N-acyl homoserine lactonase family protein [Fructobacillus parabroussonetiae]